MAQEMNEGTAYLRALKQSTGQADAGTAAAPAREAAPQIQAAASPTDPTAGERFEGTEKRRSRRYKCEGSAEVREEGCDVRTWATFTDVSVHGCYVEAQATYPAGTVLHMKLEANGMRVDCKGTVRVTYPYLGMGIAFSEMSEENTTRMRQLLATISHSCVIMGPGIASTLPSIGPIDAVPFISDPGKAIEAIMEFFENRQMLMRDDFLRLMKQSQK